MVAFLKEVYGRAKGADKFLILTLVVGDIVVDISWRLGF